MSLKKKHNSRDHGEDTAKKEAAQAAAEAVESTAGDDTAKAADAETTDAAKAETEAEQEEAETADTVQAEDDAQATEALAAESDELAKLQDDLAQLSDKHMRLMAEYDNFRRRSRQEKDELYANSVSDVVSAWLPVIDNLERALNAGKTVEEDVENTVLQGVEMVYRQALEVLDKQGVSEIEALGKTFDPNLHNAVLHVDDDQYGEQEIIEVLEKGYIRDGKVLRYSIVRVAN